MKLEARRVASFLRDPGACRLVLVHGDDAGLIRERAATLVRGVAGGLDDPFRVAVLERDGHSRLDEEATALSLVGGRRAVWVRDAGEGVLAGVRRVLDGASEALTVVEAPGLGRGRLRTLVDAHPSAVSIACYPEEGATLATTIRSTLAALDVQVQGDAVAFLCAQLGADRAGTRAELEKLALYVGVGGAVDLEAAQACVGDAGSASLDEALFAATAGSVVALDHALERALADGGTAIAVVRPALGHLQRLHQARLSVEGGASPADAAKAARPPVFFRHQAAFTRALAVWSSDGLLRAIAEARTVEQACKTTGARGEALCRRFLSVLARQAARGRV